jgi:hypothetical protein
MVGLRKIAPDRGKNVNEPAQLKNWRRGLYFSGQLRISASAGFARTIPTALGTTN